jgi:coenzyme F420-reducing hydrogenase beta subunit
MCLDYASELADLAVGDAGASYTSDGDRLIIRKLKKKYGSIIARTEKGLAIIKGAQKGKYILAETTDRLLGGAARPLHIGVECKKFANPYFIEKRKRHGWTVPNVY